MKRYLTTNVLDAARERYAFIFDRFDSIYVSVSGGKDSTVLYRLAIEEAVKRNRKINLFFLDQEMEYGSTIRLMRGMMEHPNVIPLWYQVPIRMTNATSYTEELLYAWGPGEEWMREKELDSIHEIAGEYPQRFYPFFEWFERQAPEGSAFLVGLRADESLNRFRAVTKNPGYEDVKWSTKSSNPESFKFYPLYDWGHGDIWKYIDDHGVPYNEIYDKMFSKNHSIYSTMRVSNLIHEKSFNCLTELQELEPDTYERIIKRLGSTHCAALYARDAMVYNTDQLPDAFPTWREYRDYLLESSPIAPERKGRFQKRFEGQEQDEYTYRQQCRQILINDWENNIGVSKKPDIKDRLEKWRAIL
ncbi:MAG: phosphoadenosine phosphosulfate reductase family protein [Clostridia bacterium]|nr:phosphoadenosine phosphosulfate reductase family protein [Clostridia bacterium]